MTIEELEVAVLLIIKEVYCKNYNQKLKVIPLINYEGVTYAYELKLALNKEERPLTIFIEGDENKFLTSIKKELQERNLVDTKFYLGYKVNN